MDEPAREAAAAQPGTCAWVPQFVLWLSLAATAGATLYVYHTAVQQDRVRFHRITERTRIALNNRIETYSASLRKLVALFH